MSPAQIDHLQRIHYAAFALVTFGRPKEGSDKYKAAWDELWSTMNPGPYESLADVLASTSPASKEPT